MNSIFLEHRILTAFCWLAFVSECWSFMNASYVAKLIDYLRWFRQLSPEQQAKIAINDHAFHSSYMLSIDLMSIWQMIYSIWAVYCLFVPGFMLFGIGILSLSTIRTLVIIARRYWKGDKRKYPVWLIKLDSAISLAFLLGATLYLQVLY